MVKITYRGQEKQADLAARNVAEVRELFKSEFGLPDRAHALLNGEQLKRKLEPETELGDGDELYFETPSRRGLVLLGAFLLTLALTGGLFAYTATSATVNIGLTDQGDFVTTANTTPTGWDVYRNFKGTVTATDLFTITPGSGFTGDLAAVITLANAHELVEAYRILVLEIEIWDSGDNDQLGTTEYLTLGKGEVSIDIAYDSDTPYTVKIVNGFYITHRSAWPAGYEDPLILCDVMQRGT